MIKEKSQVKVIFKGGGSIVTLPPVFSSDAEYLCVAKAHNIISYNISTGNKVIEFSRVNSEIIGFNIGFINDSEHVIACTKRGQIILWKLATGLKIREIRAHLGNIHFFKVLPEFDEDNNQFLKAFICFENESTNGYEFAILDLKTGTLNVIGLQIKLKGKLCVDIAENGKFVAAVQNNRLYCYSMESNTLRRHRIRNRTFTIVVCHPTEQVVLTGDNTGRIVIWNDLLSKSPVQAVYHWHTLPVMAVSFSKSGTQFYSGGSECVLVKWIFEDTSNSFVPRLPGFIQHITVAPDNLYIALSLSNNGIQILTPQMNLKQTIQHMVVGNSVTTDLVFDPRSKLLVFNGISGQVQFFSPRDLTLVYSLDVTEQNKYTSERETLIMNTSITNIAIDKMGLWMATVEERMDPDMCESRLKFWFYDTVNQSFTLNTSVEYPHEGFVSKVLFQPSKNENELYCVTIGSDKKFKIWQVVPVKTVYHEGFIWESISDVSYRSLSPNVASFSSDGSLLAVGFESIITTWLPDTCELKCSLRHPVQDNDLCHVSFGTDSQCHLLLVATRTLVTVWNLLSLSMVWTVPVWVQYIVSDVNSSYKAVFTADKKLYVFEPNSPNPVFELNRLKKTSDIQTAAFVQRTTVDSDIDSNWFQRLSIYVLTSDFELYAVEAPSNEVMENNLYIKEDESFFKSMLPEIRNALVKDQGQQIHNYMKDTRGKKFQQLLDTPVPSLQLSLLCEDILQDVLIQKNAASPTPDSTHAKEHERKLNENVKNKLFDKELNLDEVGKEKMQWTFVLL